MTSRIIFSALLCGTVIVNAFVVTPTVRTRSFNKQARVPTVIVSAAVSSQRDGIVEGQNRESDSNSNSSSNSDPKLIDYDWKKVWYPITYSEYILHPQQSAEPIAASIFDHPIVLWRDESGTLNCADDVCPHRAAALSEGQIYDGRLECLYHGWQFQGRANADANTDTGTDASAGGQCVKIPQLEEGASIPKKACLKMRPVQESEGVVWVWMGDEDQPASSPPLSGNDLFSKKSKGKFSIYDFQIDLPYDQSYLVENLMDPAHIPISHDATSGGGKREDAQPYKMEVDEDSFSPKGFTGRHSLTRPPNSSVTEVAFDAPGIIRNRIKRGKIEFNADLHCIPLGMGRCRLMFRVYFTGLPKIARFMVESKPMWLRHLNSCKVLEQDLGLITTQEDHFLRTGHSLSDDFLMLKSSDAYVGAYRRWMDRVGHGMPWYIGLLTSSSSSSSSINAMKNKNAQLHPGLDPVGQRSSGALETRYHRHVIHCPKTRNALRRIQSAKRTSFAVAVAAWSLCNLSAATKLQGLGLGLRFVKTLSLLAPASALLSGGLHFLEKEFYVSFKRRLELRKKSGV